MAFGPNHYVPVLKVKRGEKQALASIQLGLRQHVTPLLEIVARKKTADKLPTVNEHLSTSFRDLASSLHGYARCLLDVHEVAPDGPPAAAEAFIRASNAGILFTPVTGISRKADVASAIACSNSTRGIGIRLTRAEFESGHLTADLNRFLSANGLIPNQVDLIVDLGPVESLITAGVIALTRAFLADVPQKGQWRTLTVTGSVFPFSMGVVKNRNSSARIERSEWLAWHDGLFARQATLERLPTFSDCAIQHPAGVEGFDFRFMRPSATIRYTSANEWLLVKGESTKVVSPSIQFPQLATRLVYGQLQRDFRTAGHCEGCRLAKVSADGGLGLGSPEAWRKIGTIHHITTVVQDDLACLPWP